MRTALVDPIGLDNLHIVDRDTPEPGAGEVLVRMTHASLNYRDLLAVNGGYGRMQKQEALVPLSDGAGEVVALGDGVRGWKLGDKAMPAFFPNWQAGPLRPECVTADLGGMNDGVATEYRTFRADALVKVPASMDLRDAATLTCAAATAWNAVIEVGKAGPGETVLIQGSGGVSLFALQFAVAAGAKVIATVSSDTKDELVRSMGASDTVNYRTDEDWGKTVKKMTGGVDHVVEVGGAQTFKQSMLAAGLAAKIYMIGVVTGPRTELNIPIVAMSGTRIEGVSAGSRASAQRMVNAVAHHGIKPVIDSESFTLDTLKEGISYLEQGKHTGKIVVDIA